VVSAPGFCTATPGSILTSSAQQDELFIQTQEFTQLKPQDDTQQEKFNPRKLLY
jgi:hypothetical protein